MSAGVGPAFWKISTTLKEVQELSRARLAVCEQQTASVVQAREEKDQRIKEAKRRFAVCDEEWGWALKKAHSMRKEKGSQVQSADRGFIDAKLAFESSRFELVAALNEGEAGKQVELLESVRASMNAELEFFEKSCSRIRELTACARMSQTLVRRAACVRSAQTFACSGRHLDGLQPFITEQREHFQQEQVRHTRPYTI